MINLFKKLFGKRADAISSIGKTEIKPIDPIIKNDSNPKKVEPSLKKDAPKVEKKNPKPTTPTAKKPGRPKSQPTKKAENKSNKN